MTEKYAKLIRQLEIVFAWCLMAFVAVLHVEVLLNAGGLWRDEANSAQFALMPSWSAIVSSLRYDSYPVGSTVFFRFWTLFASSDQGFRAAGLLVGLAIAAAFWWNARTLRLGIPLLSLLLFAANPAAVRYGDAVRPYGLGILFSLILFGFLARLLRSASAGNIAGAIVSAVLCVQCLYQTSVVVAAFCLAGGLAAFRRKRYRTAGWILAAGAIAALSLVPYLGTFRAAGDWSVVTHPTTSTGWEILWQMASFVLGAQGDLMVYVWLGLCAAGLAAWAVRSLAVYSAAEEQKDLLVFAGLSLVIGIAGYATFLRAIDLRTQVWYYLPVMAPAALCLEALFAPVRRQARFRLTLLVLAIAAIAASVPKAWQSVHVRATNVDVVASELAMVADRSDLIVVIPWFMGVGFYHAYHGRTPWMSLPPLEDLSIHRYDLLKLEITRADPIEPVRKAVTRTLSSGKSVWIVGYIASPPQGQSPPTIAPAPNAPTGWSSEPYSRVWALQLGAFIRLHANAASPVYIQSPNPVSRLEDLPVHVVVGWRP